MFTHTNFHTPLKTVYYNNLLKVHFVSIILPWLSNTIQNLRKQNLHQLYTQILNWFIKNYSSIIINYTDSTSISRLFFFNYILNLNSGCQKQLQIMVLSYSQMLWDIEQQRRCKLLIFFVYHINSTMHY